MARARKETGKAKSTVKSEESPQKVSKYDFVSLSDIDGCLILKLKEEGKRVVSYRGDSKSDQDWRKVLKIFVDSLGNKKVELRFFGVKYRFFNLVKLKKEFSASSIVFDQTTDVNVLFDLLPSCADLKHVTLRGCTKYPYEKKHYAVRVHYSEVNPFETLDLINIKQSLFTKVPEEKNDPQFLPTKLLLRPYRYDTEIFIRHYMTPKRLAELITNISTKGGFYYQGEWMVYKMVQNKQLFCKCGINGVYCVVVPAGYNTINQTALERFVWNDEDFETSKLLSEPEEVNDRRKTPLEWNSLSDELKLRCIEKMHFKTRINLGSTCHNEKKLVESSKPYSFKFVQVEHLTYSDDSQSMSVVAQNSNEIINVRSERWAEGGKHDQKVSFELTVSAVKHILKFCEIGALFLTPGAKEDGIVYLQKKLADCSPFRFSTFFSYVLNPNIQLFLLGNCKNALDMVFLRITKIFAPKKYFDIPQIINSKCLQIQLNRVGPDPGNIVCMLVRKWISLDPEIGKKAVLCVQNRTFCQEMKSLAAVMFNRVISETEEVVLIRLDDKNKRILVYTYCDHDDSTYVTCRVISSELKESEYELYDRPWVDDSELTYNFAECDEEEEEEYGALSFE